MLEEALGMSRDFHTIPGGPGGRKFIFFSLRRRLWIALNLQGKSTSCYETRRLVARKTLDGRGPAPSLTNRGRSDAMRRIHRCDCTNPLVDRYESSCFVMARMDKSIFLRISLRSSFEKACCLAKRMSAGAMSARVFVSGAPPSRLRRISARHNLRARS